MPKSIFSEGLLKGNPFPATEPFEKEIRALMCSHIDKDPDLNKIRFTKDGVYLRELWFTWEGVQNIVALVIPPLQQVVFPYAFYYAVQVAGLAS